MERLTTNKNVSEMGMLELALNCCYIAEDGNARYRDYEIDVDGRDFVRDITAYLAKDVLPLQDESFDEEMMEDLIIDPSTDVRGLIAVFYRNMWAMAELREKLKRYEDAEEQGLLLRLPCKVGDTVYVIAPRFITCKEECALYDSEEYLKTWCKEYCPNGFKGIGVLETVIERMEIMENDVRVMTSNVGYRNLNNIFLTRQEAEAKLEEMEGVSDGSME